MSRISNNSSPFSVPSLLALSAIRLLDFTFAGESNLFVHAEHLKARSEKNISSFEEPSEQRILDIILLWMN